MSLSVSRTLALLAGLVPAAALACGICVDDKVAAAYDHAVVARAAAHRQLVVFAEVSGAGPRAALVARGVRAARESPGVDRASVRQSSEPAVIAFALDPRSGSPEEALARIERAGHGVTLRLLRVMR